MTAKIALPWIFSLAIAVAIMLPACSSSENGQADFTYVSKDTLSQVLTEIHLADAYLSVRRIDKLNFERRDLYLSILRKYGISQARFDSTIQYYANNVTDYEQIYEGVLQHISEMEAAAAVLEKDRKAELLDSLTLKSTVNEQPADSASVSNKAFIRKAMEKRNENEEKMLRTKKAPRL